MIDGTATVRGVTVGDGTVYRLRQWPAGLLGSADIRVSDQEIPRRHGLIAGDDYFGGRTVTFSVLIQAGSQTASEEAAAALTAAFAPAPTDEFLDVRVSGTPSEYSLLGRCRGVDVVASRERFTTSGGLEAQCYFMATDPLRYGPEQSVNISLVDPGAGLTFPFTFPIVFSGSSGSGSGVAVNSGTASVYWSATLTGPLTNPRLALVGSGRFVAVAATIAAGQTVVLDAAAGAILLNGSSPRPSWFGAGSSWWQLAPGNNSVQFNADAGSGNATVTWRPGWA